VNLALAKYRWHGSNETVFRAPSIEALIVDEWRTMERLRVFAGKSPGCYADEAQGVAGCEVGDQGKRIRQLGNATYAREIVRRPPVTPASRSGWQDRRWWR